MKAGSSFIAKISRPVLAKVIYRERLFALLDEGRTKPVLWLSAPAGAGKTTLAASYLDARTLPCIWYQADEGDADIATFFYYMGLAAKKAAPRYRKPLPLFTPEYLPGVRAFFKRFFETLCSRLRPPFLFIFDNYQNLPADSALHDLIAAGIEALPPGIIFLMISRSEPPPPYARLRANNCMASLVWDDLRLTYEESHAVVTLRSSEAVGEDLQHRLYCRTQGWIAGLVLTMESARLGELEEHCLGRSLPEEMFDYFAGELFANLDEETRDVLLKTALLPRITPRAAENLTGNSRAGRILAALNRMNCFTEKCSLAQTTYQYHPLFREFLLQEGERTFSGSALERLRREAASLLVEKGQIEDAAELLVKTEDWEGLARLMLANAQTLIVQGRNQTLEEWLVHIPEEFFLAAPWLLYWKGFCRLPFAPPEARGCFERALRLFETSQDESGAFMAWHAIVTAISYEWDTFTGLDAWIVWMEKALNHAPVFASPQIEASVAVGMAIALWMRQPDHAAFPGWLERGLALTRGAYGNPLHIQIWTHALWCAAIRGERARAEFLLDELGQVTRKTTVSPFHSIVIKTFRALVSVSGHHQPDQGLEDVRQGQEIVEESGLHAIGFQLYALGVSCAFSKTDLGLAGEFLRRVKATIPGSCRNGLAHYYFLAAWHELLTGNVAAAFGRAELSLRLTLETGVVVSELAVRILMAHVLLLGKKEYGQALEQLANAKLLCGRVGSALLRNRCALVEAEIAFETGNKEVGLRCLREALTIGREKELVTMFSYWRPDAMAQLCAKALRHGIEIDYVKRLIRGLQLLPAGFPDENWPYPLRICTLGRFEIVRDDKPPESSGKVQKKPLELLKALIALGGKDVAEEKITDLLWPDAEGDSAHRSFETTLYRLRLLLGVDNALQLREGLLTLDPRYCWVDALALQDILQRAEDARDQPNNRDVVNRLLERATALYRGHFLAAETWQPWAVLLRERLRDRITQAIRALGTHAEDAGNFNKAIRYYMRGLEIDELAEELYQQLMACYHQLGHQAKALATYQRCRTVFNAGLGIEPSARTEALYAQIYRNQIVKP